MSFGTYSPIKCWKMSTCLTESKAFLRSINMATHGIPYFFCISKSNCKLFICSTVDRSGVNPYCYYYMHYCFQSVV